MREELNKMPVAIFTGGGSWMSRWGAQRLLEGGWQIELFDRDSEAQNKVVGELGNANAVHSGQLDVADYDAVKEAFAGVVERHGRIDALVNVAGGIRSQGLKQMSFVDTTPEYWDTLISANLKSVFNATHAALPYMKAQGEGAIVSISAGCGIMGSPTAGLYSAAKAGIILFSQLLSGEIGADGIRINSIAPGSAGSRWKGTGTGNGKKSPLGRSTTAEDVGNAIAFLVSDKASHITGSCIDVSGGTSLY
jgi:NAD(P)-dependent dehydrogenase (short-subunit alcohol dehydrogenase family)